MKNKKIVFIFLILLIIVILGGYFAIKYVNKKKKGSTQVEEYTPQEEISDSQARQTIVSLYFQEKESGELAPEARLIDIKEIMSSPVEKLIELLIAGPKSDKQERLIPENTQLEKTYMEGDVAVLEFSSDFITDNCKDEKFKNNLINSIKNTLTQLTEINDIKILVNEEQFI